MPNNSGAMLITLIILIALLALVFTGRTVLALQLLLAALVAYVILLLFGAI